MLKIVFALASLAYIAQGRPLQYPSNAGVSEADTQNPSDALAKLLLANGPAAAFSPSSAGARLASRPLSSSNSAKARLAKPDMQFPQINEKARNLEFWLDVSDRTYPKVLKALNLWDEEENCPAIPWWWDIYTYGGTFTWTFIIFIIPFPIYHLMTDILEWDVVFAGNIILILYVTTILLAWTFSYLFRIGEKDTTYSQQLKKYTDQVIKKRFDELTEDEVVALMSEIYPDAPRQELESIDRVELRDELITEAKQPGFGQASQAEIKEELEQVRLDEEERKRREQGA